MSFFLDASFDAIFIGRPWRWVFRSRGPTTQTSWNRLLNFRGSFRGGIARWYPTGVSSKAPKACSTLTITDRGGARGSDGKPRMVYIAAHKGNRVVGEMWIERGKFADRLVTHVNAINVTDKRCGIGTRLYEHAAKIACREFGAPLASDVQRSGFAQGFWKKQVDKGRAKCVVKTDASATRWFEKPVEGRGGCWFYQLKSCGVTSLARARRSRRSRVIGS